MKELIFKVVLYSTAAEISQSGKTRTILTVAAIACLLPVEGVNGAALLASVSGKFWPLGSQHCSTL